MKISPCPSFSAVAELVAPYIEFAVTQPKRQAELAQDLRAICARTVNIAFRSHYNPIGLARLSIAAAEKTVDASARATKDQLLAHVDLTRAAYAGMVRAGIAPRSLLASHRLEKILAGRTVVGEQAITAVHDSLMAATLPFGNMVALASGKAL